MQKAIKRDNKPKIKKLKTKLRKLKKKVAKAKKAVRGRAGLYGLTRCGGGPACGLATGLRGKGCPRRLRATWAKVCVGGANVASPVRRDCRCASSSRRSRS